MNPCRLNPCVEEGSRCVPRSEGLSESGTTVFNYTCTDPCMRQPSGIDYSGSLTSSDSGKRCALWREAAKQHSFLERRLNQYVYLNMRYFRRGIETTVIGDTNYCRGVPWMNVEENVGPWCYVTANNSQLVRELCDVNYCPDAGKISKSNVLFPDHVSPILCTWRYL